MKVLVFRNWYTFEDFLLQRYTNNKDSLFCFLFKLREGLRTLEYHERTTRLPNKTEFVFLSAVAYSLPLSTIFLTPSIAHSLNIHDVRKEFPVERLSLVQQLLLPIFQAWFQAFQSALAGMPERWINLPYSVSSLLQESLRKSRAECKLLMTQATMKVVTCCCTAVHNQQMSCSLKWVFLP